METRENKRTSQRILSFRLFRQSRSSVRPFVQGRIGGEKRKREGNNAPFEEDFEKLDGGGGGRLRR